mmetsp:Transcript_36405/g.85110  ORF Transcript_36405/g.85110 Transcript_36405/m.85110 type:complete len:328 (-) Transcript_36405:211-1194(-)
MCKPTNKRGVFLGHLVTRNVVLNRHGEAHQRLPNQPTAQLLQDTPPAAAEDTSDAMRYVAEVRQRFVEEPNKYTSFLHTFSMYRRGRLNLNTMFDRLAIILQGHRDLLEQFVNFLPNDNQDEFRVRLLRERSSTPVSGSGATFMQALQNRFANDPQKYRKFVFILDTRNIGLLTPQSFIKETLHFLSDHQDLMLQFCEKFVPEDLKRVTLLQIREIVRSDRGLRSQFKYSGRRNCPLGISFHSKVKRSVTEDKYKEFYKFFESSLRGPSDVSMIVEKIMQVFLEHPHLQREVIPFLPHRCRGIAWNKIRQNVRASRRLRTIEKKADI